jgi:hypothetical protein
VELTASAHGLLDSYIDGCVFQGVSLPFDGPETVVAVAEPMLQQLPVGALLLLRQTG